MEEISGRIKLGMNEMEILDTLNPIRKKLLNPKFYFQSLVEQARICGLLSDIQLTKIETELVIILTEQIDKWSEGESSSIPTEKAQEIMTSIMFIIGIFLKSCDTPEQAVNILKSKSLKTLFEEGQKLTKRKTAISHGLQKRIINNLFNTSNSFYRSTIVEGLNGFFKLYNPQFSAHEIHITVDYPIYIGRPELCGIEFIERYLRYIEAENGFCICFNEQDIHHLLCGLTQDYHNIPMNIFEPVLLSALGLTMLERNPKLLNINRGDISLLYQKFSKQSLNEIINILAQALCDLEREIILPKTAKQYISLCIPAFASSIMNSTKMKNLDKLFLVPSYPEYDTKIMFSYGIRMDDKNYQKLVEKIIQADSSEEKITHILNDIHSLADLLDILSDTELDSNDFKLLINMLPLSVFIGLLAQYPSDDFIDRESEQLLFLALQKRKKKLSTKEKHQVEQVINSIQREEI